MVQLDLLPARYPPSFTHFCFVQNCFAPVHAPQIQPRHLSGCVGGSFGVMYGLSFFIIDHHRHIIEHPAPPQPFNGCYPIETTKSTSGIRLRCSLSLSYPRYKYNTSISKRSANLRPIKRRVSAMFLFRDRLRYWINENLQPQHEGQLVYRPRFHPPVMPIAHPQINR